MTAKTTTKKASGKEEALKDLIKQFTWHISGLDVRAPTSVKLSPKQMALLESVIAEK